MSGDLPSVVVVDDAPDVRRLVTLRLRLSGELSVVGQGGDGVEAVRLAEQHRPSLLLLDVSMPGVDGLEALPRIREVSPQTQVVLYSGFDEPGLAERGRALGAAAYLSKATPLDRLVDELLASLGRTPAGDGPQPAGAGAGEVIGEPGDARLLGEHLERFREVFDEAAIGMATLTLTGRIIRANRALRALLGSPDADLVGVPYTALASDAEPAGVASAIAEISRGSLDSVHVEHGVASMQGDREVRATLAVVRGEQGKPLYLSAQVQDVTEERRATEQLRQSEERFRLLVEAVEDYAIFMLDPEGRVASWNAGAQRIKGYTAEEIIGQHFRVFYPPEKQRERHPEHELVLALRDGHYEEEGWRVRKDGTLFWANVVITAVHTPRGEHMGFTKVTRDITERRRASAEREESARALARANNELAAVNEQLTRAAADQSRFLAVTAHELRGPVGLLGGSASTLADHWSALTDEDRRELFAGMASSAARLRRLLADLLLAARLDAGAVEVQRRRIDLAHALDASAAMLRARSARELAVTVHCPPGLHVEVDPERLAQAIDNLLDNAVQHGRPPVVVTAATKSNDVEIRIRDAGPGVPAAMRPRLFERFATGEQRRGTGLGLFIVRQLARAHGGDAWYEEGDGATASSAFVLAIPRA